MQNNLIKLTMIKVDFDFNFQPYLYLLSTNSQLKILNYKFKRDQNIAFTSEILKQYYIAHCLDTNFKNIKIMYTKYNRPFLINNTNNIDFNISHSGEYVLLAITYNAIIGVDIEHINNNIVPSQLADIVFSMEEKKWVGDSIRRFFYIWTRKESLIKAQGVGFNDDNYTKISVILDNCYPWLIYSEEILNAYYLSICLKSNM